MKRVKLMFTSGHAFGARLLSGLIDSAEYKAGQLEVAMVHALHPRHAADTVGFEDLGFTARANGLACMHFDSVRDQNVVRNAIDMSHQFHFVVGLSQLAPAEIMQMPARHCGSDSPHSASHGAIGVHPTLLPEGRGRAPIPWTILRKKKETGLSSFFLTAQPDAGPIIDQVKLPIRVDETAGTLFDRFALEHEAMGRRLAPMLAQGAVRSTPQSEDLATNWEKRSRQLSWVDFSAPIDEIQTLVRAVSPPYPPAFAVCGGTIIQILEAKVAAGQTAVGQPGEILEVTGGGLKIRAGDGAVLVSRFAVQGSGPALKPGMRFHVSRHA